MRASTQKAIEWAIGLVTNAELELTPAGFKYHSERLWVAQTATDDLILLTIPADGKDPSLKIARAEYLEAFNANPPKKKVKKKEKNE